MNILKKIFNAVDDAATEAMRSGDVKKWLEAITDAIEREKEWRKQAARVVDLYEQERAPDAEQDETADFNILFANTETMAPAVYNNTPRPVVKRKVDKENPVAIAASKVVQHALAYLIDTGDARYAAFDDLNKSAVLEALVPGRGNARFSYDPTFAAGPPDAEGKPTRVVAEETVCGDAVPWNRFVHGYSKQWHGIPWKAYEHFFTREECVERFGKDKGNAIKLTHTQATKTEKESDTQDSTPADSKGVKFAHIWEVWDKSSKKQIFLSDGSPELLETNDDPFGLEGFFPSPRPIQFLIRIKSLTPNVLYLMYEKQAKELDDVTRRIGALTRALKIRGFYDSTLEKLDELMTKPDNTLFPAQNVAAMQQGQTLDKAIWLMPIEKLITVLQQLYMNRQQIIAVIQKLSGVADIMMGASQASETLGAQKIKESWGTMRLKRMQKEVQRFSRDCLRIQAELACKHFSLETFVSMTGLKFPRAAEQQQAQMQMQQLMQQADALQAQAQSGQQVPPQAGQQMQQQMAQIKTMLAMPNWEAIHEFLKNDKIRNYVIDIETNSTVDIEATEDKQELAEFMNAMAQVLNGTLPMVKEGVMPFDAAKALMVSIVRQYRLDDEVEEAIRNMQAPQPQQDPAKQKVEAEMKRDEQKFALEQKGQQAELQQKQELAQMELQIERERLDIQREQNRLDREMMVAKHQLEMQKLAAQTVAKTVPAAAPAQPAGGQNAAV